MRPSEELDADFDQPLARSATARASRGSSTDLLRYVLLPMVRFSPSPCDEVVAQPSRRCVERMEATRQCVLVRGCLVDDVCMYVRTADAISPWLTICRCRKVELSLAGRGRLGEMICGRSVKPRHTYCTVYCGIKGNSVSTTPPTRGKGGYAPRLRISRVLTMLPTPLHGSIYTKPAVTSFRGPYYAYSATAPANSA
jgi:hypothetical protein